MYTYTKLKGDFMVREVNIQWISGQPMVTEYPRIAYQVNEHPDLVVHKCIEYISYWWVSDKKTGFQIGEDYPLFDNPNPNINRQQAVDMALRMLHRYPKENPKCQQ